MEKLKRFYPLLFILLSIASVIFISYSILFTTPSNFTVGEFIQQWSYGNEVIKNNILKFHQLGLWDNKSGLGYPLMADISSLFYPFTLIGFLFSNPRVFINVSVLIHLILAAYAFYYLARVLKCSHLASFLGSIAYTVNSYMITTVMLGFFGEIYTLVWTPLTIAFLWQALFLKNKYKAVIAGVCFSMNILSMSVYPIFFLNIIVLSTCLFYFIYRLYNSPKQFFYILFDTLLTAGIVYALTLSLSAVKLFPVLEFKSLSIKDTVPLYGTDGREWILLDKNTWLSYVSVIPLSFSPIISLPVDIVYGIFVSLSLWIRKKEVILFSILSMVSIWAAFGKNSIVDIYKFFYYVAPGINTMESPLRFLIISNFTLAVLFTLGLTYFLTNFRQIYFRKAIISFIVFLFVGSLVLYCKLYSVEIFKRDALTSVLPLRQDNIVNEELSALVKKEKQIVHVSSFYTPPGKYVVAYTAFYNDFYITNRADPALTTTYQFFPLYDSKKDSEFIKKKYKLLQLMNTRYIVAEKKYDDYPNDYVSVIKKIPNGINYIDFLTREDTATIYKLNNYLPFISQVPHTILLIGKNDFTDFDAFEAKAIMLSKRFDLNSLSVFTGLHTYSKDYTIDDLKKFSAIIVTDNSYMRSSTLSEYKKRGGKVLFLSFQKNLFKDLRKRSSSIMYENSAKWLGASDKKALDNLLEDLSQKDNAYKKSETKLEYYSPERITISTKSTLPLTYLRISESFYPGWKVNIDNKPSSLYMADGLVKGIIIAGTGKHVIDLVYKPTSFYAGAIISFLSFVIILCSTAYYFHSKIYSQKATVL